MSSSTLAPGLLLSAPPLEGSVFGHSVILLATHDQSGAFGWITNGPDVLSLAELLEQAGLKNSVSPRLQKRGVRLGGPVAEEQVWLLVKSQGPPPLPDMTHVSSDIWASGSKAALGEIASGQEVDDLLILAGYAGWAGEQLEGEIGEGSWLPAALNSRRVFAEPGAGLWAQIYTELGTSPLAFNGSTVGKA